MELKQRIRSLQVVFRYRILIHTLLGKLGSRGFLIVPFMISKNNCPSSSRDKCGDIKSAWLSPEGLHLLPFGQGDPDSVYRSRLNKGDRCCVVKIADRIIAYTWVDFHECNCYGRKITLKPNEAYLYDTWVLNRFRGRKIAAALWARCIDSLTQEGWTDIYVLTDYFNRPARKLLKRCGMKVVKIGICIQLFRRYCWTYVV